MDVIPLKRLYLVAGFDGQDLDTRVSGLQRHFEGGDRKFIGRVYPSNLRKRATYLQNLVEAANKIIFGIDGAVNFCRKQDQLCAVAHVEGGDRKKCERKHLPLVACGRARPKLIIVLCASRIYDEVFRRLGRAALLIRFETDQLPGDEEVLARLEEFEPVAQGVINEVSNRAKSLYAPLIPFMNFQNLVGVPIASEVQEAPEAFAKIMQDHHKKLYNGAFRNPKKKKLWGAYMLDGDTAFQQDHLHTSVQIIGEQSRTDGFHLLNAYHVYGVPTDPGFHFDVMNVEGKAINRVFQDVLTRSKSDAAERHVNITPCDRRL